MVSSIELEGCTKYYSLEVQDLNTRSKDLVSYSVSFRSLEMRLSLYGYHEMYDLIISNFGNDFENFFVRCLRLGSNFIFDNLA